MAEHTTTNVPRKGSNVKLTRQLSIATEVRGARNEERLVTVGNMETRSKHHDPMETVVANLGTVSEISISISNHEFDFSSIEEFKSEEKQEPLNCRETRPFPKIAECK